MLFLRGVLWRFRIQTELNDLFPMVVADIGATNARFGIVENNDGLSAYLKVQKQHVFKCSSFDSFEAVLNSYLADYINSFKPRSACIAIAGPVVGDRVQMTNRRWGFSIESLSRQFNLDRFEVINDFGAQAYATVYVDSSDRFVIQQGQPDDEASRVVIGPGSGLGIAGLVRCGGHWYPVSGEGGHITFAPVSEIEFEIMRLIEPNDGHVAVERLVSGPGLVNLHKSLTTIHGVNYEALTPKEISERALTVDDPVCVEALAYFFGLLGRVAGDACLMMGATGGVILAGGILPQIQVLLENSSLLENFKDKGPHSSLLEKVPVYLIKNDLSALVGAAHWLYDSSSTQEK